MPSTSTSARARRPRRRLRAQRQTGCCGTASVDTLVDLICGHSTFCASAAFANERAAIIAVHEAGAIRPTSELLDDDSADALSVRLVRSPLLGGRTMAGMGWPGVQRFLNGVT